MKSFIGKDSLKDAMTLMKGDLSKKEDIVSDFTDAQVAEMWDSTNVLSYSIAPEYEIDNFKYTLDEENKKVILTNYIGKSPVLHIYNKYIINGEIYHTKFINDTVIFNGFTSSKGPTSDFSITKKIILNKGIDTSEITFMENFFRLSSEAILLTSLDLSSIDVSNVTNMYFACYGNQSLISLNVSSWNVSKVTNMVNMFAGCKSLESLDLTSFDIRNATSMNEMFYGCMNLKEIKVSRDKWVIPEGCNITDMFRGCGTDHVTYVD